MRNTTVDFWIVQEKPQAKPYDPWNAKTNDLLGKARHLPYTLQSFARVSERMSFEKLPSNVKVLGHKRAFINNMNDAATDAEHLHTIRSVAGERYLTDESMSAVVWGQAATTATTKPKQYVHIKFCPHTGVYPLKRAIGEAVDGQENMSIRPNRFETRSLGTMAWDNFDPKANKWLIITTDFQPWEPRDQLPGNNPDGTEVETSAQYLSYLESLKEMSPQIKVKRRVWWRDPHVPADVMGIAPTGSTHRHLQQTTTAAEWDTHKARLDFVRDWLAANPNHASAAPPTAAYPFNEDNNNQGGVMVREEASLLEFFHRFPMRDSDFVLP